MQSLSLQNEELLKRLEEADASMSAAQQELNDAREQQQNAAEDAESNLRSNQVLETAEAEEEAMIPLWCRILESGEAWIDMI